MQQRLTPQINTMRELSDRCIRLDFQEQTSSSIESDKDTFFYNMKRLSSKVCSINGTLKTKDRKQVIVSDFSMKRDGKGEFNFNCQNVSNKTYEETFKHISAYLDLRRFQDVH